MRDEARIRFAGRAVQQLAEKSFRAAEDILAKINETL